MRTKAQITPQPHTTTSDAVVKYLVVVFGAREQVVTLPFAARHADVLEYLQGECPGVRAVSGGIVVNGGDGRLWVGGQSTTLGLRSRPQDRGLIEAFLSSEDRRVWDLAHLAGEAKEAAALNK
jgi:hypothetical protein